MGGRGANFSDIRTRNQIKQFKEKGTKVLNKVPEGFRKIEGATTAPRGYEWYSNNVSRFKPGYEAVLVKQNAIFNQQNIRNNKIEYAIKTGNYNYLPKDITDKELLEIRKKTLKR